MNFLGVPAPVVTILTPSSITTSIISLILGIISIKLTAKGFVVCSLHFFICSRSSSGLIPPEANIPKPPALETALASS